MILALAVGLCGGIGATARYLIDEAISRRTRPRSQFPYATMTINLVGSLILGILTGLVLHHGLSGQVKLVVGVGFCGGLTTWSTASWESVQLFERGDLRGGVLYTGGSLVLALGAATLGLALAGLH